jgi:hypothetical protein
MGGTRVIREQRNALCASTKNLAASLTLTGLFPAHLLGHFLRESPQAQPEHDEISYLVLVRLALLFQVVCFISQSNNRAIFSFAADTPQHSTSHHLKVSARAWESQSGPPGKLVDRVLSRLRAFRAQVGIR